MPATPAVTVSSAPERSLRLLPVFNIVAYVLVVVVNALANTLPLNGLTTGAISDSFSEPLYPGRLRLCNLGADLSAFRRFCRLSGASGAAQQPETEAARLSLYRKLRV